MVPLLGEYKQLTLGEVVSEQLAANIFDNQFPQKYYEIFLFFSSLNCNTPMKRRQSKNVVLRVFYTNDPENLCAKFQVKTTKKITSNHQQFEN